MPSASKHHYHTLLVRNHREEDEKQRQFGSMAPVKPRVLDDGKVEEHTGQVCVAPITWKEAKVTKADRVTGLVEFCPE